MTFGNNLYKTSFDQFKDQFKHDIVLFFSNVSISQIKSEKFSAIVDQIQDDMNKECLNHSNCILYELELINMEFPMNLIGDFIKLISMVTKHKGRPRGTTGTANEIKKLLKNNSSIMLVDNSILEEEWEKIDMSKKILDVIAAHASDIGIQFWSEFEKIRTYIITHLFINNKKNLVILNFLAEKEKNKTNRDKSEILTEMEVLRTKYLNVMPGNVIFDLPYSLPPSRRNSLTSGDIKALQLTRQCFDFILMDLMRIRKEKKGFLYGFEDYEKKEYIFVKCLIYALFNIQEWHFAEKEIDFGSAFLGVFEYFSQFAGLSSILPYLSLSLPHDAMNRIAYRGLNRLNYSSEVKKNFAVNYFKNIFSKKSKIDDQKQIEMSFKLFHNLMDQENPDSILLFIKVLEFFIIHYFGKKIDMASINMQDVLFNHITNPDSGSILYFINKIGYKSYKSIYNIKKLALFEILFEILLNKKITILIDYHPFISALFGNIDYIGAKDNSWDALRKQLHPFLDNPVLNNDPLVLDDPCLKTAKYTKTFIDELIIKNFLPDKKDKCLFPSYNYTTEFFVYLCRNIFSKDKKMYFTYNNIINQAKYLYLEEMTWSLFCEDRSIPDGEKKNGKFYNNYKYKEQLGPIENNSLLKKVKDTRNFKKMKKFYIEKYSHSVFPVDGFEEVLESYLSIDMDDKVQANNEFFLDHYILISDDTNRIIILSDKYLMIVLRLLGGYLERNQVSSKLEEEQINMDNLHTFSKVGETYTIDVLVNRGSVDDIMQGFPLLKAFWEISSTDSGQYFITFFKKLNLRVNTDGQTRDYEKSFIKALNVQLIKNEDKADYMKRKPDPANPSQTIPDFSQLSITFQNDIADIFEKFVPNEASPTAWKPLLNSLIETDKIISPKFLKDLYTSFKIEEATSNNKNKAFILLLVATVFTRLNSSYYFGLEFDSAGFMRFFISYLIEAAILLDKNCLFLEASIQSGQNPDGTWRQSMDRDGIKRFTDWDNRLFGKQIGMDNGQPIHAFTCTAILSGMMKDFIKVKNKKLYDFYYPFAWK